VVLGGFSHFFEVFPLKKGLIRTVKLCKSRAGRGSQAFKISTESMTFGMGNGKTSPARRESSPKIHQNQFQKTNLPIVPI
jgi:hypothetical protein